jgi:hypothetical protein
VYAAFNGMPLRRIQIKNEAVKYMKDKYNMDVAVVKSGYNFKFKDYLAFVYDVNDKDKRLITIEQSRAYDESKKAFYRRMEDNYSVVYYERLLADNMKNDYPSFFKLSDIDNYKVSIAQYTQPLNEGVTSETDINGVRIPDMVKNCTLDMDLKCTDFSDEFLGALLDYTRVLVKAKPQTEIFITCKPDKALTEKGEDGKEGKERRRYIKLDYNEYINLESINDLKRVIGTF